MTMTTICGICFGVCLCANLFVRFGGDNYLRQNPEKRLVPYVGLGFLSILTGIFGLLLLGSIFY